jgi:cobalt/nickel transport system permease protein
MHIPDGFLSAPTAIGTGVVAAGAVAYALREGRESLADRQVPLVGVTAAFVFAVQMLNFPIALGTSGHLIGGALAAILLGPWTACLVLAVVLGVQAIGFADGGITALGANVTLMGLIAGVGGHHLFRALAAWLPRGRRGFLTATAVTSWATVVVASVVCSLLITLGGPFGIASLGRVLPVMTGLHALIGVGEAAITTAAVGAVIATRPDLVTNADLLRGRALGRRAVTV